MLSDFSYILSWWFFLSLLGWIYLPLTNKLFGRFYDKGYLFSKVLGIAFSTYFVWILASLKVLPFSESGIWLSVIVGLVINGLTLKKNNQQVSSNNRFHLPLTASDFRIFVFEELLFLTALAFWSYVRGFQPDIQGLEKFMDYGFVNSILRSEYFPPADMWFAGKSINYYYFGHYITAFLTKFSGISSAITYNLMLATLFSFCFSLAFSLTSNLVYLWKSHLQSLTSRLTSLPAKALATAGHIPLTLPIIAGLLSALIISLGANLHPAIYNFKMGVLKKPYCGGALTYWYPNATRYIGYCPEVEDKTIHEFPSYSFVVSDLHGHVSNIPFVMTFLALTLILLINIREGKMGFIKLLASHFPLPLLLAIFFMTNQWDYPIYLMVLGGALLYAYYTKRSEWLQTLKRAVPLGIAIILFSIPLLLPFQLGFENITKGIGLVRTHSLPYQLLILWGWGWFFGLSLIWFLFFRKTGKKESKPLIIIDKEGIVRWFASRLGVEVSLSKKEVKPPTTDHRSLITVTDAFVLIMFLVSIVLIIIPEIIYVKDIYIPSYHRANTMFKLTYQSFIMFSILVGYVFIRVLSSLRKSFSRKLLFIGYCLLVICLLVYPFYSIKGYYGQLKKENYKGLYGLNFINRLYPDDYQAILWLNSNVVGQPNILEAVGDSYTDYERISMATGLPTIEGWLVHEWLWRGAYDQPGARAAEVQSVYDTADAAIAKAVLDKYQVKYVIVGGMEKTKYPNLKAEKFNQLGKPVFTSATTTIYQIN